MPDVDVPTGAHAREASLACFLVVAAAIAVLLGWLLSALHQLTAPTLPILLIALAALVLGVRRESFGFDLRRSVARMRRRLRSPLPLVFYVTVFISLLGGLLYPPDNGDALSYRIPRVLAWWANHGWYWIPSADQRMNYSGTVQEWLFFPVLALTRSDRLLFLVNLVPFTVLPFLLFSSFVRLGIRPRVAWWWMWLLPVGMGIMLQAGSTTNDLLGLFFGVAAIDTALRYRVSETPRLLCCSMLAIALCTGVKASNLPLALPWLAVVAPVSRRALSNRWRVAAVLVFALAVSILPTLALNRAHTGSAWGDPMNRRKLILRAPVAGVVGNLVLIVVNNCDPPVLPYARRIAAIMNQLPGLRPGSWLKDGFPNFEIDLKEVPRDEQSGFGLLLVLLLIWSMARSPWAANMGRVPHAAWVFAATGVASVAFMASLGSNSAARLYLPYSVWVVCFGLWLRDSSGLVRTRAWRACAVACVTTSLLVLIFSPSRPLLPVRWMLRASAGFAPSSFVDRVTVALNHHDQLADAFAAVRADLSPNDRMLGFVGTGSDLETALWRPFGSRRVIHVLPGMTAVQLRELGIRKVVASQRRLRSIAAAPGPQFSWLGSGRVLGSYPHQEPQSEDLFLLLDIAGAVGS
jgi:hypothetical protein